MNSPSDVTKRPAHPLPESDERARVKPRGVSRRDFLKFSSLMLGGLALPLSFESFLDQALAAQNFEASNPQRTFQWQNEILRESIYPLREQKLRDFLIYYQEVDVWAGYKGKDISAFTTEVHEYKKDWESKALAALVDHNRLRDYFLKADVQVYYYDFPQLDEEELAEVQEMHELFAGSWPADIRGERSVLNDLIARWERHLDNIRTSIDTLRRRHEQMDPAHPSYVSDGQELDFKENITLPMAEQEMDRLRAFLTTYDRLEGRKLDWFEMESRGVAPAGMSEAEFLGAFPPDRNVTTRDLANWKVDGYTKSLEDKNQYELLDMIHQRFKREPGRFPAWLQYMLVHFSGMRYASAHGSWADPKDLLVRLRAPGLEAEIESLDEAALDSLCAEKVAAYGSAGTSSGSNRAGEPGGEWWDRIARNLPSLESGDAGVRRQGLVDLRKAEEAYQVMSKSTEEALSILRSMKKDFPAWAWMEIVSLTPLRVTEVVDPDWEKHSGPGEEDSYSQENDPLYEIINSWKGNDPSAWREEHERSLELNVTRLVCNEAAEHCQHVRGHRPPGGLAARPDWYLAAEGTTPGAYFSRPTSAADYTPGASILWLRFVNSSNENPTQWRTAKPLQTRQEVGLLPDEPTSSNADDSAWKYSIGDVITRKRTTVTSDNQTVVEQQWLRWIHEATVAEVAETADGMVVLTFETALPGGESSTSAVGIHKTSLAWHLSDGSEDQYNRSFVGYVPEGSAPAEGLKKMLAWDKIFRK